MFNAFGKTIGAGNKFTRNNIIFGGLLGLATLLLILTLLDGYLFYFTVHAPIGDTAEVQSSMTISGKEIDEAAHILDDRAQKLQKILSSAAVTSLKK